jgi:hypothetical protein
MRRKRHIVWILPASLLILSSCKTRIESVTLEERLLPHPNPTSYVFNASIRRVKEAVEKCYGTQWRISKERENLSKVWDGPGDEEVKRALTEALRVPPGNLYWKGDPHVMPDAMQWLYAPGNENDAYYYCGDSTLDRCPLYLWDGHPLPYRADLQFHITPEGDGRTQVKVLTHRSQVIARLDESWSPHGSSFVFVDVPPTTIEQYRALLAIGRELGAHDMPPLITPNADAPVRYVTLPRAR